MKRLYMFTAVLGLALVTMAFVSEAPLRHLLPDKADPSSTSESPIVLPDDVKPIPNFIHKGLEWLAAAQFENGGWGAGSHSRQEIRDPRAVQIDPATTAFSAIALMRSGSTLQDGIYSDNINRAMNYLLDLVDASPPNSANITSLAGTQPQAKLGQNIDVAMVSQFFTEVLPLTSHDAALERRVANALEICVTKLARSQDEDGSWNSRGGWASVLQSAMANNALEMAQDAGVKVDKDALERSRAYQKSNVDAGSGEVKTESAAGISLYTIASNQRATAKEAREAEEVIKQAARDGRLDAPAPDVSEENFQALGYSDDEAKKLTEAYRQNKVATDMLRSEEILSGFGNNGGEEFLSYMMTSESLVVADEEAWNEWYNKMHNRLSKIQNPTGSWSGHHCITSPVFCTAAVIMTMTADRAPLRLATNG